jgi:hypothetical protein
MPDGGAKSCRKGSHLHFELKRVNWRLSWVFGGRPALKRYELREVEGKNFKL